MTAPSDVAAADLDQDGDLDLAVVNQASSSITVFLQTTLNNYVTAIYMTEATPTRLALADYNSDNAIDIATAAIGANRGTLLLSNGNGTFAPVPAGAPFNLTTAGIAAADFNGDDLMDLAATGAPDAGLAALFGKGDGSFEASMILPSLPNSHSVVAADLNLDGRPDLAATSLDEKLVAIFLSTCP
jgi:hypothetical protein